MFASTHSSQQMLEIIQILLGLKKSSTLNMTLTFLDNLHDEVSVKLLWNKKQILPNYRDNWEKKPILIQRQKADYYKGLFSTAEFDLILRNVSN